MRAPAVSRCHAEAWVEDGVPYVKDLGSANGTFVNAQQVDEARLTKGDRVTLGRFVVFSVEIEEVDAFLDGITTSPDLEPLVGGETETVITVLSDAVGDNGQ